MPQRTLYTGAQTPAIGLGTFGSDSVTGGKGCEASIDCSGAASALKLALQSTRQWRRCALVGEGGILNFDVSPLLIHPQVTLYSSWVTSVPHMEELLERLLRWGLHPETDASFPAGAGRQSL